MSGSGFSAIIFGLLSAISWGAGDFSGGLAAKRENVYRVVILSQMVGALFLLGMALIAREPFTNSSDILIGALAGVCGAFGLLALYRALAIGPMGIVAPMTAVVTALIPLTIGFMSEGLPTSWQFLGFCFAFLSIWLVSFSSGGGRWSWGRLRLPVIAGLGFGLFFVLISRVQVGAVYWPLVSARAASLVFLSVLVKLRAEGETTGQVSLALIILVGLFDSGGNVFYTLATQAGRLDVAAVLASLYPGATVFLSRTILKERLTNWQWMGVLAALLAIVLISR